MGEWGAFKDFTSKRGSDDALMLGAAINYQGGANVPGPADETKTLNYTFDASWESDGWNLYGAFVGSNIENFGGVTDADADIFGFVVQGGFYLTEDWELFGRYDMLINDDDLGDDFGTFTVGANHYIHGHAAKFTLDLQWFFDDTAGTGGVLGGNSGIGLLADTEEDQVAVRAQFQLLF
jgi:hypothetical protein